MQKNDDTATVRPTDDHRENDELSDEALDREPVGAAYCYQKCTCRRA